MPLLSASEVYSLPGQEDFPNMTTVKQLIEDSSNTASTITVITAFLLRASNKDQWSRDFHDSAYQANIGNRRLKITQNHAKSL